MVSVYLVSTFHSLLAFMQLLCLVIPASSNFALSLPSRALFYFTESQMTDVLDVSSYFVSVCVDAVYFFGIGMTRIWDLHRGGDCQLSSIEHRVRGICLHQCHQYGYAMHKPSRHIACIRIHVANGRFSATCAPRPSCASATSITPATA